MQDDLQTVANSDGVSIHSGFPNPGLDRRGQGSHLALDLNRLLIKRPSSTYLFRVAGHRWSEQGIDDNTILVVDRAQSAQSSDLVVAWQETSLVIAQYRQLPPRAELWGVITTTIRQYHD
jgi:DNA polymerase V